ncbi:DUF3786 domain-containing protein [Ruminococcus sp. OA3]|uniref:DUF3786 domain-containing protein n=1 Tax=Ruminococcus sp. OA3 TaxID=2914164 RepID=UPI001F0654C2|nr:DUF3786 domain-containing protein [Ruminococcus sp. OA3]MCH1983659.1 DUF3786 domain-containing protein [Ruminococcus sp. OA3]
MNFDYEKDNKERIPYEHYLERFQQEDPLVISGRTQIPYDEVRKIFTLRLMGSTYEISWPEYEVHATEDSIGYYPLEQASNARILVLRYLLEGSAAPSSGNFLTYREIPWGEVYFKQFQGRCIFRLAFGFGSKIPKFQEVMERLGAAKISYGDCSYEFEFMNNLYLRFILWEGDDEFPPSAQILFSDNFPVAFHGEDMAVVGDISIGMIKALSVMQQ